MKECAYNVTLRDVRVVILGKKGIECTFVSLCL